jgi:hypothetical protein
VLRFFQAPVNSVFTLLKLRRGASPVAYPAQIAISQSQPSPEPRPIAMTIPDRTPLQIALDKEARPEGYAAVALIPAFGGGWQF